MRDPAVRIDPDTEAAIEDTRRLLEPMVRMKIWEADLDREAIKIIQAFSYIEENSPDWVKTIVREPLMKAAKKRYSKPSRHSRDMMIAYAANRLIPHYRQSRNDATRDIESASSIICKALRRLGVNMEESTIKEIIGKHLQAVRG